MGFVRSEIWQSILIGMLLGVRVQFLGRNAHIVDCSARFVGIYI